jgi:hypothetical protein
MTAKGACFDGGNPEPDDILTAVERYHFPQQDSNRSRQVAAEVPVRNCETMILAETWVQLQLERIEIFEVSTVISCLGSGVVPEAKLSWNAILLIAGSR